MTKHKIEVRMTYRGVEIPQDLTDRLLAYDHGQLSEDFRLGVDTVLDRPSEATVEITVNGGDLVQPLNGFDYWADMDPIGDRFIFRSRPGSERVERFYEGERSGGWEHASHYSRRDLIRRTKEGEYRVVSDLAELPDEAR